MNLIYGGEIPKGAPDGLKVSAGEDVTTLKMYFVGVATEIYTNFGSHQVGTYLSRKLGHLVAKNLRIDTSCVFRCPVESMGFSSSSDHTLCRARAVNTAVSERYICGLPRFCTGSVKSQTKKDMIPPMFSAVFQ